MISFSLLPHELLPEILGHFRYRQADLARTSLVCREWASVSKPVREISFLYRMNTPSTNVSSIRLDSLGMGSL